MNSRIATCILSFSRADRTRATCTADAAFKVTCGIFHPPTSLLCFLPNLFTNFRLFLEILQLLLDRNHHIVDLTKLHVMQLAN